MILGSMISAPRRRVLDALVEITADGWPASVDEIRARTGHGSKSTVWIHLNGLIIDGFAARHPRIEKGGFRPTEKGRTC